MMESASAELCCNIHKERQSSSNSISGFQSGGSSKPFAAVLAGLCVQLEPKEGGKNPHAQAKRKEAISAAAALRPELPETRAVFPTKRQEKWTSRG